MSLLTALILSDDESFRTQVADCLHSGTLPVSIADERPAARVVPADLVVVDGRGEAHAALGTIERTRAGAAGASIFMVALESSPDLILQSMRAGANEFLTWPPAAGAFADAVGRAAARRSASPGARPPTLTVAFLGAKGGAGTTTVAVNGAVELARLGQRPTVIADLKAGLGEVTLFLGVRSRYSILDAIDNLHRLDGEFLKELVVRHKSGLDILAGAEPFDRPGPSDAGAVEAVLRLLTQQYEYVVIDAGNQFTACSTAALYTADMICLVTTPDVPCVRNAERMLDRLGQLGAAGDRVRVLLNRASEPYPIPPEQIERALGRPIDHMFGSDYRTVSTALNSGVPLSLTGSTDLAGQFDSFTRTMLDPASGAAAPERRSTLGLHRLASIW
ncbi:MAG: AAA family ATPase [Acidobacteria bacterium]|nr:AAA family ATPase [Acidobacteriota bacterium]